jgi:hypothetical protein
VTQADVARTIRAAMQAGASSVEIRPDGTIVVRLSPQSEADKIVMGLEEQDEVVL